MGARATLGAVDWNHGFDDYVSVLTWEPDGDRLAAASLDGTVRILDGRDGAVVAKLADHPMGVLAAAWAPDGRLVATGGHDGVARVTDATDGTTVEVGGDEWVACLAWRPDGTLLAIGSGRTLRLVAPDGTVVLTSEPTQSTITSLVWSVDGRRVGASCYGGVGWYEPDHGPAPVKHFAWKGSLLTLAVSPDGRWLTGGAQDQSVHIWRLWSADDLEMSGYPTKVEHLSWHHSSRYLAVGNLGEITVWDFSGRGPSGTRPRQLEGHDRHISALSYQHRGDLLASGGADGKLLIWDGTRRPDRPVDRIADTGAPISTLAWSADDRRIATAHADGRVSSRLFS